MIGYVYSITCNVTGYVYIGSTFRSVRTRINEHLSKYKAWKCGSSNRFTTSYICFANNCFTVKTLERLVCNIKRDLLAREAYYIDMCDKARLVNCQTALKRPPMRNICRSSNKHGTSHEGKLKYLREKIACPCGASVSRRGLARHKRTKKHIEFRESLPELTCRKSLPSYNTNDVSDLLARSATSLRNILKL